MPKRGSVTKKLIKRIKARDKVGAAKYGQPLETWDGRNSAEDALEEVLDLAAYLTKLIEERKQFAEYLEWTISRLENDASDIARINVVYNAKHWHKFMTADIPRVGVKGPAERLEEMGNG